MYNNLPHGIKISITRSIKVAFENYMESIHWDEDKYNFENFLAEWKKYSEKNASWFENINKEMLNNPTFSEELLEKINDTIKKMIITQPTEDQMKQIDELIEDLGIEDIDYCCKMEADFVLKQLNKQLAQREKLEKPATDEQMKLASILYYQAYDEELPGTSYTNGEIKKIIDEAKKEVGMEEDNSDDNNVIPFPIQ